MESASVSKALDATKLLSYATTIADLLKMHYPVMIYAAEWDMVEGAINNQAWIK